MNRFFCILALALFAAVAADAREKVKIEGARNISWSPDSSKLAYTVDGDLYFRYASDTEGLRLTTDGGGAIRNGYASWVYFEEIFGRASAYKAFWWSPDSQKIAFYRFDESRVPVFPIYSPAGQDGKLNLTRYPKAGEPNPEVRIGIVSLPSGEITWAGFDGGQDRYFGTPFWGPDSRKLFVGVEPRVQNRLELFAVNAGDGSVEPVYREQTDTWLEWMDDILFDADGLYMARCFDTPWQQIYYLSYDGKTFRALSEGENWRVRLLRKDPVKGDVYFTANRDSHVRSALYRLSRKGKVTTMTDPAFHVAGVEFSEDGKTYTAYLSNANTPHFRIRASVDKPLVYEVIKPSKEKEQVYPERKIIELKLESGFTVPAMIVYPEGFDPSKKYPLHMEIYGGPNTAYVRDEWRRPSRRDVWLAENGFIHVVADCRASGHNGKAGTDAVFRDLTTAPVEDFVQWARYFKSLPYVGEIGVEGFSFGGTMTAMLVMRHPELFRCGIAGGGVYDWSLYDSHYTERFMLTPQLNPEGYRAASVLEYVREYDPARTRLKLTHGTGDDNVHFQNTLQLVDSLQKAGLQFDLMVYPDGMHGYRGAQGIHSLESDKEFWINYLKTKQ